MKKRLLTILMCLCTVCALTACGDKKENNEVTEETNNENEVIEEEVSEEEIIEENAADLVTVTLYSYYTDSYYKVKVDKNEVYEYAMAMTTDEETYNDLVVYDNNINENDLYSVIYSHINDGTRYDVFNANQRYNETINGINWRIEYNKANPDYPIINPDYNEEWADYFNEYKYNKIIYTVGYANNGSLIIYIKNPYTDVYDLEIERTYIGKNNSDYLKIAEQLIDSIEFVEP